MTSRLRSNTPSCDLWPMIRPWMSTSRESYSDSRNRANTQWPGKAQTNPNCQCNTQTSSNPPTPPPSFLSVSMQTTRRYRSIKACSSTLLKRCAGKSSAKSTRRCRIYTGSWQVRCSWEMTKKWLCSMCTRHSRTGTDAASRLVINGLSQQSLGKKDKSLKS